MRTARDMTDAELADALSKANAYWDQLVSSDDDDIARGGSPLEWAAECIDELETEVRRRASNTRVVDTQRAT